MHLQTVVSIGLSHMLQPITEKDNCDLIKVAEYTDTTEDPV